MRMILDTSDQKLTYVVSKTQILSTYSVVKKNNHIYIDGVYNITC